MGIRQPPEPDSSLLECQRVEQLHDPGREALVDRHCKLATVRVERDLVGRQVRRGEPTEGGGVVQGCLRAADCDAPAVRVEPQH
jgi:hypothetical protein